MILGYLESPAIFTGNDRKMAGSDWLLRLMSRSVMTGHWANKKAVNLVTWGRPHLEKCRFLVTCFFPLLGFYFI